MRERLHYLLVDDGCRLLHLESAVKITPSNRTLNNLDFLLFQTKGMFVNSSSSFISASQSQPKAKNLEEPREYLVQSIDLVGLRFDLTFRFLLPSFSTTTCLIQFVKNHHDFLRARRSAFSSNSSHAKKNHISPKKTSSESAAQKSEVKFSEKSRVQTEEENNCVVPLVH